MQLYNCFVSVIKSLYYNLSEPMILRLVRLRYKKRQLEDNPLVSIIIATYNRSQILINRTLPTVLSQTYNNIEVVIVGDHCIDNTPELLKDYPDNRVRFFDLKKRGKYPKNIKERWFVQGTKPRNKAMKIAKGDWFVFISDDDIMYPHHVETLINEAVRRNVEFISASYETVKEGVKIIMHPKPFNGDVRFVVGGMQTWMYRSYLKFFKWNIDSWRKSWNRPVDYDLQLRFYRAGVHISSINEIVYNNPVVEGTNTTGYDAILSIKENR